MSHVYSTITVNRDTYNNLQRSARDANDRVQRAQSETGRVRQQFEARERETNERHRCQLEGLDSRIASMDTKHSRAIRDLNSDFHTQLTNQRNQFVNQMNAQRESFQGDMQELETRLGNRIGRLSQNINQVDSRVTQLADDTHARFQALVEQSERKEEQAQIYHEQVEAILETIAGLRPDKFRQDEYRGVQQLEGDITSNIESGNYEAAIGIASVNLRDAMQLEILLYRDNTLFNARLQEVEQRANEVETRVEAIRAAPLESKDEEPVRIQDRSYNLICDVSRWNGEILDNLTSVLQDNIKPQIENAGDSTTTISDLDDLMYALNDLDSALSNCSNDAYDAMVSAYAVREVSQTYDNILRDNNWEPVESAYVDRDVTKPTEMVYQDNTGNELVVSVQPGNSPESPVVNWEVFSEGDDEDAREIVMNQVQSGLQHENIESTKPVRATTCQPDIDSYRQQYRQNYAQAQSQRLEQALGAQPNAAAN